LPRSTVWCSWRPRPRPRTTSRRRAPAPPRAGRAPQNARLLGVTTRGLQPAGVACKACRLARERRREAGQPAAHCCTPGAPDELCGRRRSSTPRARSMRRSSRACLTCPTRCAPARTALRSRPRAPAAAPQTRRPALRLYEGNGQATCSNTSGLSSCDPRMHRAAGEAGPRVSDNSPLTWPALRGGSRTASRSATARAARGRPCGPASRPPQSPAPAAEAAGARGALPAAAARGRIIAARAGRPAQGGPAPQRPTWRGGRGARRRRRPP